MDLKHYFGATGGLPTKENISNFLYGYPELYILPAGITHYSIDSGANWIELDLENVANYFLGDPADGFFFNPAIADDDTGKFRTLYGIGYPDSGGTMVDPADDDHEFKIRSLGNLSEDGASRETDRETDTLVRNAKGDVGINIAGAETKTMTAVLMDIQDMEIENFLNDVGSEEFMVIQRQVIGSNSYNEDGWFNAGTKLRYRIYPRATIAQSGAATDKYNDATSIPIEIKGSSPQVPRTHLQVYTCQLVTAEA